MEVKMPSGSCSGEGFPLLHFGSRLYVTRKGLVYDMMLKTEIRPVASPQGLLVTVPTPKLTTSGEWTVKVALLIALAFKKPNIPYQDLLLLQVLFKDGNVENIDPDNLVLKYPSNGIRHQLWPGFCYIPGYSHYIINREGTVISLFDGKLKRASIGSHGYYEISVSRDIGGTRAVGIHRLLGLAFLDYDHFVQTKVVNHKDNNRLNNCLENLEWVTQKQNIRHGMMFRDKIPRTSKTPGEVNRPYRVPVSVKDLYTGEVKEFGTITDCANYYNCNAALVHQAIQNHAKKTIFKQRFVVKLKEQEWPDITVHDINGASMSGGRPVLVKDLQTGAVSRYEKAAEFVRMSGLSKKVVTSNLRKDCQVVLNNLIFKYADSQKDWIA